MKTARQTAFEILNKIQRDNSYSDILLDSVLEKSTLDLKEKAFVASLVYGVIERSITLDFELSQYLKQPIKKLKPQVLTVLRLGAYQLLFMNKIPASAAINESVKLIKNNGSAFASGLVNAVLRNINSNGLTDTDDLSLRYSAPQWLCDLWSVSYGKENAEALLNSSFGSVETTVRVNTLKTSSEQLIDRFLSEGVIAQRHNVIDDALIINSGGALHKTKAYCEGLFHVQDAASQLCCRALGVKENEVVLDICSAPGGKSFTLAQMMNNTGEIHSFDIYKHRLNLIDAGAERLAISNIKTRVNDGSAYNSSIPFADKILCDVPCSGLGVIRKKPEIRYKKRDEVDKLPDLQYSILCISSQYLKTDGTLVYSTCSLNPDENEKIIKRFLDEHSEFESVCVLPEVRRYNEYTDYISLMPHIHHCDGFFISAIKKVKDV